MALGSFVAGKYSATYNSGDLGMCERGWNLSFSYAKDVITDTDTYAKTDLDAVHQGIQRCQLSTVFKEWLTSVKGAINPYISSFNSFGPGLTGVLDSAIASALVLSAAAGTSAALSPATFTASNCVVAEGNEIGWQFGMDARKISARFRIYPVLASSVLKFFTLT